MNAVGWVPVVVQTAPGEACGQLLHMDPGSQEVSPARRGLQDQVGLERLFRRMAGESSSSPRGTDRPRARENP